MIQSPRLMYKYLTDTIQPKPNMVLQNPNEIRVRYTNGDYHVTVIYRKNEMEIKTKLKKHDLNDIITEADVGLCRAFIEDALYVLYEGEYGNELRYY